MVLDCTYKTNKYNMPLLDIVGVDACKKTFSIAFAFMSGERQEDFYWVLNQLKILLKNTGITQP